MRRMQPVNSAGRVLNDALGPSSQRPWRRIHEPMADVWVLLLILAFFALCVALVRGCDRIIGPDAKDLAPPPHEEDIVRESVRVGR
jgi:hypothetical protein